MASASLNPTLLTEGNDIPKSPTFFSNPCSARLKGPYPAFELYHSRHSQPIGMPDDTYFSLYQNPAYDQVVDARAGLPFEDPHFHSLAVQAMELYRRDVIDIPVSQWLNSLPYNQTCWTNWPTQDNLAIGTSGAFWAHTGMLVITDLQPAQKPAAQIAALVTRPAKADNKKEPVQ